MAKKAKKATSGSHKASKLEAYRRKRSAQTTPEPFGSEGDHRSRMFVVQKHAATRMHYDLRLEIDGVLHSWAVPKGPSLDPEIKRLAMEVEDHPLEYGDFEGLIPEGNYGAGAVIVFDRGRWVCLDDEPDEGLRKGKLLFDLWGYKLRGRWTLFRTKGGEPNAWLLMKKPDAFADPDDDVEQGSVFTGRTVEELRDGLDVAGTIRKRLARKKVPEVDVDPRRLELMLAQPTDQPFSRPGWLFELKYDGFRLLAARDASRAFLRYRRGADATAIFPEIATGLRTLPFESLVLDGEVVVLDEHGRPNFQRLQQRVHLKRKTDVDRATVGLPATLFVFDLVSVEGFDVRALPLVERKAILEQVVPALGPLRYAEHWEEHGETVFAEVGRLGFEGIVAKRAAAAYRGGRHADWQKIRVDRTADFAVVGYSRPKGTRTGIGALHLAVRDGTDLRYAGRVGTGFSDRQLDELREVLDADRADAPRVEGEVPRTDQHVWVEPRLVVEVRYKEWTEGHQLRHPVFLRMRDDKTVEECDAREIDSVAEDEPPEPVLTPSPRTLKLSNLDKVFWPTEQYTKGDLIEYYRTISGHLLPYLRDRPLVLTRYPDGIEGKNFYQKDAPGFVPDWIRTETMWSEHAEREIRYFICEDEESLLYIINLGTIPLHLWSSRTEELQHPDWSILDLDPKGAPFEHVVRIARAIHALCREIGMESFVKTSGSTGLHVLLPLAGQCTYDQSRTIAELLARVVASEHPEIATLARAIAAREGRVYLDFLQNGHGKLLVSPFCVRPRPGATVSTPLRWSEVDSRLDIDTFTIRTVPERLKRQRKNPWSTLLTTRPDLESVLARLAERLDRG